MRKIQILGAFIVVLAFSALAVTDASATLWLHEGKSLTEGQASDGHGILLLHHTGGLAGNVLIECTWLLHGTVGPGALGLVTEVLGLSSTEKNKISCVFTEGGSCGTKGEKVTMTAINLPWHTLLLLVSGGGTVVMFLPAENKEPGYEFPCPKLFGFKGSCTGENEADFLSNGTNGAIFHSLGIIENNCSDGGKGTILGLYEWLGGYTVS